jgi:hypothetical protein
MKNNLIKSVRIAATAVMFLGLSWNSQAQTFPDREVSLIVNYGGGRHDGCCLTRTRSGYGKEPW